MVFNEYTTYSWQGVVNSEPSTGLGTWSMEDDILTFVENGESSSSNLFKQIAITGLCLLNILQIML